MSSQWPSSMKSSIRLVTSARVASSWRATTLGVKKALISRLYWRCSGGSITSGMALTLTGDLGTFTPSAELNVSQSWATRSTSS